MEEEGDVVYFETSPAAEQLTEVAGTMSANIFSSSFSSKTPLTEDRTAINQTYISSITHLLSNIFYKLKNLIVQSAIKEHYTDKMVGVVKDSAMLTDQDYQVLDFVLSEIDVKRSKVKKQQLKDDSSMTRLWYWAVLIGLVSVAMVLAPVGWVWCGGVIVVTCVIIAMLVRRSYSLSMQYHSDQLDQYLVLCDSFLSLLTQCVRSIQEQEVVYTGYDRLSRGVPVARLDSTASRSYQCAPLRKRVLSVCRRGVEMMGASTRSLVDEFSINEELDCRQQYYLAFSDLQSVHDALASDEDDYSYEHLSLESLKTAANHLAVQNSEFLKRMALVLHYHGLWASTGQTKKLLSLVKDFITELRWGLDFQKNRVLEAPPVRPSSSSSPSTPSKQQLVSSEMRHADLHAVAALTRLRENEDSMHQDHLQLILSSLNTAASHVAVAIDLLSNRPKQQNTQEVVTEEEREEEEEENEERTQECVVQEETDSEDEMVFEAYATVSPEETRTQDEAHDIDTKEQRESSAHMLRELHSVLAVRNITREEKRERKRARGKGHSVPSPSSTPSDQISSQGSNLPQAASVFPLSTPSEKLLNSACIDESKTLSPLTQSKQNSDHQPSLDISEKSDIDQDPTPSSFHVLSEQDAPPTESNVTPPLSYQRAPFSVMATALSQVITASRSTGKQRHREEEVFGEGEKEHQEEFQ